RPPRAPRSPEELLTVARRATEIHLEHKVAIRGEILILEIEPVLVRAVRTAVVCDDERIRRPAGAGLVAVRVEQKCLDRRTVETLIVHALDFTQRDVVDKRIVYVRQLTFVLAVDARHPDFRWRLERPD